METHEETNVIDNTNQEEEVISTGQKKREYTFDSAETRETSICDIILVKQRIIDEFNRSVITNFDIRQQFLTEELDEVKMKLYDVNIESIIYFYFSSSVRGTFF